MPSETYFRLPDEKRQKILAAIHGEFTRVPYQEVSINRIIRDADIPRGSFYQYFVDKQDVFVYLLQEYHDRVVGFAIRTLEEQAGDPFAFVLAIYDAVAKSLCGDETQCRFCRNLLGNLRLQDREFLQDVRRCSRNSYRNMRDHISPRILCIEDPLRMEIALEMIHMNLFCALCELFDHPGEHETIRKQLQIRQELLQHGIAASKEV